MTAVFRALTKAADEGLLTSGFFWIPSLGGPTSMAMRQAVSSLTCRRPAQWQQALAAACKVGGRGLDTRQQFENCPFTPACGFYPCVLGSYRHSLLPCSLCFAWVCCLIRLQGSGLAWLFPFENGQPPIGWHDAGAYLILPLLLIASQYASQKLVTPQSNDPAQQQTQAILGFLPLMIGEHLYYCYNVRL